MADETVFKFVFEDGGGDEPQKGESAPSQGGQDSGQGSGPSKRSAGKAFERAQPISDQASGGAPVAERIDPAVLAAQTKEVLDKLREKDFSYRLYSEGPNPEQYADITRPKEERALRAAGLWAENAEIVGEGAAEAAAGAETTAAAAMGSEAALASMAVAVGVVTAGLTGLATVAYALDQNLAEMIRTLGPYSAAIQGAEARAENRRIANDIRQAQIYGPDLARYVSARSEIEVAVGNIANALGGGALEQFLPLLEAIAVAAKKITDNDGFRKSISENIGTIIDSTFDRFQLRKLIPAILDLLGATEAIKRELASDANILDIFDNSPDLTVDFGGKTYGTKGGLQVNGGAQFRNPPPVLNLI